jgi:hypothetical protein
MSSFGYFYYLLIVFYLSCLGVLCQTTRQLPTSKNVPLIWPDQLNIDPSNSAQNQFIASHYVGSQKLTTDLSGAIRAYNPNFIVMQYHKAYGVDIGGNIVGPTTWADDMATSFNPWVASQTTPACQNPENYFLHYINITSATRVQHYFNGVLEYYLADPTSSCWIQYLVNVTISRCLLIDFDGVFFDASYFPYYGYEPAYSSGGEMWFQYPPWNWPAIANGASTDANNWNSWVVPYWAAVHSGLHSGSLNYFILPNPDNLITSWYLDEYLNNTDGGFIENFFSNVYGSDWQLAAGRILNLITGQSTNKIMIAQPYPSTITDRVWAVANYLLLRNSKSYLSYGTCICWYPEWEINLGDYNSEPPDTLSAMFNNVYFREYANGLVLVNPASTSQTYTLDRTYYNISFWGGGALDSNGVPPSYSINVSTTPLTGTISVPSQTGLILTTQPTPPPPFSPTVLNPPNTSTGTPTTTSPSSTPTAQPPTSTTVSNNVTSPIRLPTTAQLSVLSMSYEFLTVLIALEIFVL